MTAVSTLTTADQVKAYAAIMELEGVDFLDRRGRMGARRGDVRSVRLTFIDGTVARLPFKVFCRDLGDVQFKLRPAVDDA